MPPPAAARPKKKSAGRPDAARRAGAYAEVRVDRVDVAADRRPLGDVAALAESIGEVGRLLQPVVVNEKGGGAGGRRGWYTLVAGMTRLEAVRLLGWKTVPAHVVRLTGDEAELAELDENLVRAELTAARRAALTWRRQQAYERLHPESRNGVIGATVRFGRGHSGTDATEMISVASTGGERDEPSASVLPAGFAADTAARVGRTPRSVRLDAQVGRELGEEALNRLEATPVGRSVTELAKLARIEPRRRTALLREIERGGHAKVSHAEAALAKGARQAELRRLAKEKGHQGEGAGPRPWSIVTGDCLDVLAAAGRGGNGATAPDDLRPGTVRMCFADPPYDLGKDYGRGAADDRKGPAAYEAFTRRWVELVAPLLTPDGSLWACVDHRCLLAVLLAVRDAGLHQRGIISWADPFAQYQPMNFTPGRFLVYATRHPRRCVFHGEAVSVPSRRQTHYGDGRANPAGRTPPGVWTDIGTLCGTFAERGEGQTQLPVALVERPLLACTDEGDLVLDPFGGEGTTAVATTRHGRRSVLVERYAARAERARLRVAAG